ncbi:hypothetical protein BG000_005164 [Podila horticola]|nr:hypothetical protein BG000_005164 [Podila horticola]
MVVSVLELPELLESIASHLNSPDLISAACVCKAWSPIFIARIWHTVHNRRLSHPRFQELLAQNGRLVRSLTTVGTVDWPLLLEHCQLDVLDMTLTPLDIHLLEHIVQSFPRLRRLTLRGCYGQDLAWLQVLQELKHLECLKFLDCDPEITEDLVEEDDVGSHGEEQEETDEEDDDLDDPEYHFDPDESFDETNEQKKLPFDYLGDLLVAARTLTELNLHGSSLHGFELWENLSSSESQTSILALKRLSLAETSVMPSNVVVLLKQCPRLEELDLSGNFEPSWENFPWSILGRLTTLAKLNLSQLYIDSEQVAQVLRDCTGLTSLTASQSNIQDTVLDSIVEMSLGDQRLPLVELDVSWCPEISEAAVARILSVVALKSLKLSWCAKVESTIFRVPWACIQLEVLEAQGLDHPSKEKIGIKENGHNHVQTEEEDGTVDYDQAMFAQLSCLIELQRLVIGSSTTTVSVSKGFRLLSGLSKLQELILVGDDEYPMGEEELKLIAQFPRLSSFEFSVGLVDGAGQTALAGMRPSLRQQEQEIYF